MRKIKDVKGVKGIKILMKEVTSSGKHNNDLVGVVNLPLNVSESTSKMLQTSFHLEQMSILLFNTVFK